MTEEGKRIWPRGWQRPVLAVLGLANAWSAWQTFRTHPLPALLNATAAIVLLVFALAPWRRKGETP